jgi:hypothetical protein
MLSAHCGVASVASNRDGSLSKTGQDRKIIFRWRFQPVFSRETACLAYTSKAQNLLGCLGCAAEQSMQHQNCYSRKLTQPSSRGSLYIKAGLR